MHLLHYKRQAVDELLKKVFSSFFYFYRSMEKGIKNVMIFLRFLKEHGAYLKFKNNFSKESSIKTRKRWIDGTMYVSWEHLPAMSLLSTLPPYSDAMANTSIRYQWHSGNGLFGYFLLSVFGENRLSMSGQNQPALTFLIKS